MPNLAHDLSGLIVGRLTVLERIGSKHGKALWKCKCRCGKCTEVISTSLTRGPMRGNRKGATSTCGRCNDAEKYPKEYQAWSDMRCRCFNPDHASFRYYGGRGIEVCYRWHDFLNFYEDLGPAPDKDYSLERVNVNGNYEPGNCKWALWNEQMKNRRFHNKFDSPSSEYFKGKIENGELQS